MNKSHVILLSFLLVLVTSFGFSQSVPPYVPTNGIVGWWGFNGNAQDGSGNGNHGTVNGATLTTDRFGNQNGAYQFANSEISIADNSLLDSTFSNSFSLAFWYNSFFSSSNNFEGLVCRGFQFANPPIFGVQVGLTPSGLGLQTNPINCNPHFSQVDTNVWKHILLSFQFDSSGNGSISYYSNGLFEQVYSCFRPLALGNNNFPLKFGVEREGTEFFKGKLDDIGIWNRALTPQEITNLYNSQLPAQTSLCLPTITTSSPTSVGVDTVVIGGDVSNDGGSSIVLRGICYSTSPNPNMGNQRTEDGSGIGSFNTVLRGLTSSTTYYARSYAKNSSGVVTYGNEVSFTTSASLPGLRCPGTPTVTDIDGNVYNTVQIGNQCWTQSNLKVSKYRNGDSIPYVTDNLLWSQNVGFGSCCHYDNNLYFDTIGVGRIYNGYAVLDVRGLCPTGWHIPVDADWTTLENAVGGSSVAGIALKSSSTQTGLGGWSPNPLVYNSNSSGFTALSGGFRDGFGVFDDFGRGGGWWSASRIDSLSLWSRRPDCCSNNWLRMPGNQIGGFSVRCLKNTLPQVNTTSVTNVTPSSALVTGEVISEGDQNTTRGFCYSTTSNPTLSNDTTMNGTGTGVYSDTLQNLTPSNTYYVRAYATNSVGTSYGTELSFTTSLPGLRCPGTPTVTDIDGNIYNTVQIGNQCWTQGNLKVSKYRNGDNIPTGLSDAQWGLTSSGAYAIYNNDPANDVLFGKLYNHYAVTDNRGLCPTGWHVPSDGEWNVMVKYLDPNSDTGIVNWWQGGVAGGLMKSTATQPTPGGWNLPNVGATNTSGYTGLPGGGRDVGGGFFNLDVSGFWWSYSLGDSGDAFCRILDINYADVLRSRVYLKYGYSVRCLKNTLPQVNTTSVTNVTPSSAFVTGEVISEGGDQNTTRGFCYSTTSNPNISNDTTMNGTGTGAYSDTLQNLTPSTTYYVRAYATNSVGTSYGSELSFSTNTSNGFSSCGAVSDIDGNHYQTVLIGSQCWTQSNLRTSRYINGDSVVTGLSDTSWSATNQGAFIISQYPSDFGFYYNHYAAIDSRGICPTGWHLPSENDWNLLIKTVDNLADTGCINWCEQSTWGAMSLKSSISYPNSPIGWSLAYVGGPGSNSSGFTSLPAGVISTMGHFIIPSSNRWTNYWSTSIHNSPNVPTRMMERDTNKIFKALENQKYGFSIRCIKN